MRVALFVGVFAVGFSSGPAFAAVNPGATGTSGSRQQTRSLSSQLELIRAHVIGLEQDLLTSLKGQKEAQANLKKLKALLKLQQEERDLGRRRMTELNATIQELESRRVILSERVKQQQKSIHSFLQAIGKGMHEDLSAAAAGLQLVEKEKLEAPRRKALANLTSRGLKEIEILKVDLADAEKLEGRIAEEQAQLQYLFQDLNEKEGILELNRQLQADLLRKNHDERVAQLENYRKFKAAESQVEDLIQQFNARVELQRTNDAEREASRAMSQGVFAGLKGKLPLPVANGKVLSAFGKTYDPKSRLYVFKKGVDIGAGRSAAVQAVSAGKIAYSGELPSYGKVAILDHGNHFYSLCAHLGSLSKKAGDPVAAGERIGETDDSGTPVYFEIRARNVAVNPLQWITN